MSFIVRYAQTCARGYSQNTPWEFFVKYTLIQRGRTHFAISATFRAEANFYVFSTQRLIPVHMSQTYRDSAGAFAYGALSYRAST